MTDLNRLVFIGSELDCFKHLVGRGVSDDLIEDITELCGVKPVTVREWIKTCNTDDPRMPGGEIALRLRVLLFLAGYGVGEFTRPNRLRKNITFVIAFNLETPKDILAATELATMTQLWNILYGSGTSEDVEKALQVIADRHSQAILRWSKFWGPRIREHVGGQVQPVTPGAQSSGTLHERDMALLIMASASGLGALINIVLDSPFKEKLTQAFSTIPGSGNDLYAIGQRLAELVSAIDEISDDDAPPTPQ